MKTRVTSGPGWALSSEEQRGPRAVSLGKNSPGSPKPQIRIEKRNGKSVTVIAGLQTYGSERLEKMAREIKTLCGCGGTVKNGVIEIQGDKLVQVKRWFARSGDLS